MKTTNKTKPITRKEYNKDQDNVYFWIYTYLVVIIILFSWIVFIEIRISPEKWDRLESEIEYLTNLVWEKKYWFEKSVIERLDMAENEIIELNKKDYNYKMFTWRDEYINCVEQNWLHTND